MNHNLNKISVLLTLLLLMTSSMEADSVRTRIASYYPEGRTFVCVNGNNRYTRALYGSTDEWRLETSDRPIFAIYKKNNHRNIRFRIKYNGMSMQIDSAEYCKAIYVAGRRDYILRDKRWGNGELRIATLAYPDSEGAIWKFEAKGFEKKLEMEGLICETSVSKFVRFGDLGRMEKPGCFEAPVHPVLLNSVTRMVELVSANDTNKGRKGKVRNLKVASLSPVFYFSVDNTVLSTGENVKFEQRFSAAEQWREKLSSSIVFNTPDIYLNPIGGTMVMAADGAWSGQVWMHGAVGWRMPLPGWRAAYMGDFLGMQDRQRIHFDAYAKSQVTDIPVTEGHLMDVDNNLSRGAYKWGTPMYSNGYICRNPENNKQFHHYDMNLVYIDELLWHFQFDADTVYMRKMWPVIKSHLAWEKNTFDPDNDGLYDAYCCIWASDALQYNSGAVTHSSAYNYRGNLLAARIAEIIGENPKPYREEAQRILNALNARLWLKGEGHWAEYQDFMGLKRVHEDAALWSIYTPIDCGVGTPEQNFWATKYIDRHIPHIPYLYNGKEYRTISTSDWSPYEWSLNNVAMAEVMHTVLAYYQAGRVEKAYQLLKANILDFMYLGGSPGNFGQLSTLDRAIGEAYRDFSDVTGISSRVLIEGLYGITPNALEGEVIIRPGFPAAWDSASVHTPYLDYSFKRLNGKDVFEVKQNFKQPLKVVIRQNLGFGKYKDTAFTSEKEQHIELTTVNSRFTDEEDAVVSGKPETLAGIVANLSGKEWNNLKGVGNDFDDVKVKNCRMVNMDAVFNSDVTDIFTNKYLSPRSPYTTLCVPTQGMGDWCSTKKLAKINDTKFRSLVTDGVFTARLSEMDNSSKKQNETNVQLDFRSPANGKNIAYASLWDNYPDSISIPLKGKASHAYLLMAGSTNPMQYAIENAVVKVEYADGTSDQLMLVPPVNWCPIEQDFVEDATAYPMPQVRPYRIGLNTGIVSRHLFRDSNYQEVATGGDLPELKLAMCALPGGAATMLDMPLNPTKKLRSLTLRVLSNEVVIGLMGITLQK